MAARWPCLIDTAAETEVLACSVADIVWRLLLSLH